MSHIAADGFDFSKPYVPSASAEAESQAGKGRGKDNVQQPRKIVAALLGGLGRK